MIQSRQPRNLVSQHAVRRNVSAVQTGMEAFGRREGAAIGAAATINSLGMQQSQTRSERQNSTTFLDIISFPKSDKMRSISEPSSF